MRGKTYIFADSEGISFWQADPPNRAAMVCSGWAQDYYTDDVGTVYLTRREMDDLAVRWLWQQMSPKRYAKAVTRLKRAGGAGV